MEQEPSLRYPENLFCFLAEVEEEDLESLRSLSEEPLAEAG